MNIFQALEILEIHKENITISDVTLAHKRKLSSLHPESQKFLWWEKVDTGVLKDAKKILIQEIQFQTDWILSLSHIPPNWLEGVKIQIQNILWNLIREEKRIEKLKQLSKQNFIQTLPQHLSQEEKRKIIELYDQAKEIKIIRNEYGWIEISEQNENDFLWKYELFLKQYKVFELHVFALWWYLERVLEFYILRFERGYYDISGPECVLELFEVFIKYEHIYDNSLFYQIMESNLYFQEKYSYFLERLSQHRFQITHQNQYEIEFE